MPRARGQVRGQISLGKVFGIPLRLHYTWFIIFGLVTYSLIRYAVAQAYPVEQGIVLGVLTSALFFTSIITHELAHSIVAIRNDIPVREITLFVFGGVSQTTREATSSRAESLVAVVGPLTSLGLAGVFYGLHVLLAGTQQTLAASLMQWLALINVLLAVFNSIPAFPLDGGRLFRALLWHRMRNYRRATRIASRTGQVISFLFIAGGIALILFARAYWFSGLWFILIGWFLYDAARASYYKAMFRDTIGGLKVGQVTDYGCPSVDPDTNVSDLIQSHVLPSGRGCFFVTEGGALEGMVTLDGLKKVSRERWPVTSARDIMIPAGKLKTAPADQDVLIALQDMIEENTDHLAVSDSGRVVGVIHRDEVIRYLRTRSEFEPRTTS
ncbi:MAG: site-2 protease family protein [Dehalococcoidia bacterium]